MKGYVETGFWLNAFLDAWKHIDWEHVLIVVTGLPFFIGESLYI